MNIARQLVEVNAAIAALAPLAYIDFDGSRQELPPSDEGEWLFARLCQLEELSSLGKVTEDHSIEMIMGCCMEDQASVAERQELCQHWEDEK